MTKKQAKSTKKSALKLKAVDPKAQFAGFKKFIKDQGLIGMAIGLILGTASGDLVKSLINNIIMPPLHSWISRRFERCCLEYGKNTSRQRSGSFLWCIFKRCH